MPIKKTKIVCTIGPASQSPDILKRMILSGMNVARLNFAHGDFSSHAQTVQNIRRISKDVGIDVAVMGDLPGPKLRIGRLKDEPVRLVKGQDFILMTVDTVGNNERVSISFENLPEVVQPGDKIFLNDGFIQLKVKKIKVGEVHCEVEVGDELRSFKGVNLPGIDLGICAFTEKDCEWLAFAKRHQLDVVGQSFVQCAQDIVAVREAAEAMQYDPFIVAKIERSRAVDNLDTILEVVDGIMVARGDLGVEIPIEEIAVVQKQIIRKANFLGIPVITATQMLESMVSHNRPTRAEATDVANAILDGTDCVMLSGETATGAYPVEAVTVMSRIAEVTEPYVDHQELVASLNQAKKAGQISTEDRFSLTVYFSIQTLSPVVVFTPTLSGSTPRRITRFRPGVWIIAVSPDESACKRLQFSYGVYPILEKERPENWEFYARNWLEKHRLKKGLVLLTHGTTVGKRGGTNQLEIFDFSQPPSEASIW